MTDLSGIITVVAIASPFACFLAGVIGHQFGLDAGLNERRAAIDAARVARAEAETRLLVLRNELRKLIDGA